MASKSLGVLTLDLIAKVGGFVKGMDKAERAAKKKTDAMKRDFKKMGKVVGTALAATATALSVLVDRSIDAGDAAAKGAQRVGVSIDTYQSLAFAAELAGLKIEEFQVGLRALGRIAGDAQKGSTEVIAAYQAIGVSALDANNNIRDSIDILYDVADAFAAAEDGPGKTAIAMKLLGDNGAKLIPLLNQGSDAIRELQQQARDLGLVMSDDAAHAAEQYNDQMTVLGKVWKGIGNQLAAELLPNMIDMSGLLIDLAIETDIASTAGEVFGVILKGIASAAIIAGGAIATVAEVIGVTGAALYQAATGNFKAAKDAITADSEALAKTFELLDNLWSGGFTESGQQAAAVMDALGAAAGGAGDQIGYLNTEAEKARQTAYDTAFALRLQVIELQEGAEFAEAMRLAKAGLNDEEIKYILNLQQQVAALEASATEQERLVGLVDKYKASLTGVTEEQLKWNQAVADLADLRAADLISPEEYNKALLAETFDFDTGGINGAAKEATDELSVFADQAARNMQGAFADFLFDPFDEGLSGMLQSFADTLQRMAAEAAAAAIFDSLFGSSEGGGGLGGILAGLFGGGKAGGGSVSPGQFYQVGEHNRPELFTAGGRQFLIPGDRGRVTPGGGGGVVQNFNITTPNPDAFRASQRQIARESRRRLAV